MFSAKKALTRALVPMGRLTRRIGYLTHDNDREMYKKILAARRDMAQNNPLYQVPAYTKAMGFLVEKQFRQCEDKLKEALDEVYERGIDHPGVLSEIYTRQALCFMGLGQTSELEEALRELVLVAISDPECPPETQFHSFYNFVVFFLKHDPKRGGLVYDFFCDVEPDMHISPAYKNELKMAFALMFQLAGDAEKAEQIYEGMLMKEARCPSKGIMLNNYGVLALESLKKQLASGSPSTEETLKLVARAEEALMNSILELEGFVFDKEAGEFFGEEKTEKLKSFLFRPEDEKFGVQETLRFSLSQEDNAPENNMLSAKESLVPLLNLAELYLVTNNAPQ